MPWPKKKYYMGCCIYCHQEYKLIQWHQGFKWCRCPGAVAEQKRRKYEHNRIGYAVKQEALGRVVITRREKKPSAEKKRIEVTGVYIKTQRMHKCRVCGIETINWFLCPVHLSQASSNYDLSLIIETGESRHLGARALG